jgi:hypothetical protein
MRCLAAVKHGALALALLALASGSQAQQFSVPSCDKLIDASYDQLSNSEKAAKIAKFGGCWKSKADQHLQREYRKMTQELSRWEGSAKIQAQEQIREYGDTATAEMVTRQKDEVNALNHEYDSQVAALQLSSGEASSREIMEKRREINKERQDARGELQDQHKDEREELAKEIQESRIKVEQAIDDAVRNEEESLVQQLAQKLAHIKRSFEGIVNGPMDEPVQLMGDESPVGEVRDLRGEATVLRMDGKRETVHNGLPIYQGDIVETGDAAGLRILFVDETDFAISGGARLAIDEYVYDPETETGTSNFSIFRGLFVFTSGLVSRDDPEEIEVDTPVGSIGIRG